MKISVVVPCYNEEEALPIFYHSVSDILDATDCEYELVLVNDGSLDHTLSVMKTLAEMDKHVIYLSLSRNFGKEGALYAGLCNSRGDYVAVMDADMQDPPDLLPKMISCIISGEYDCVAARRMTRTGEPPIRSWFAGMFYRMINHISDTEFVDGARDFRLMTRAMADAVISMGEYNRFSKGLFSWVGFRTQWLEYTNIERVAGKTKWNFWSLLRYAVDGIINFSQAPLLIASGLGMTMSFMAMIMLVVVVLRKIIYGDPVAGWASTICVIIFIGGLQLFCLGIIGQYLAKTYLETKHRPHFIVAETNAADVKQIQ